MPQVIYDTTKGLYQSSGSGFQVNGVSILEEVQAMTEAGTANAYGVTTIAIGTGGYAITLEAPTTSEPAGAKKFITAISRTSGTVTLDVPDTTIKSDGSTAIQTITFDAAGESVLLLSNGSNWVVVAAAGATQVDA